MDRLLLILLLLFYFKAIFYLLLDIVMILSTFLTKVILMGISLFALSVYDINDIEASSQKNTITKIRREKLAIAPVFFL